VRLEWTLLAFEAGGKARRFDAGRQALSRLHA
jgi:hypothetical protein